MNRKKYEAAQKAMLQREQQLDELKGELAQKKVLISALERDRDKLREEIKTLNASLDATAAELEKIRNALRLSEQARKKMLKERRRS
ncbi:MAG: hypothetical protein IK149_01670 [Oscillospiraceae bacterium]|nr:hypothetical protein [Oscillospiraceae bacterium]